MTIEPTAPRVILVDDEKDFREPVLRYLARSGMEVLGLPSAEGLEAAVLEFRPDVVLLDVNMPGESGFDAAQRLRALCRAGVVMLTARGELDDRVHGLEQGADHYLVKPVEAAELVAVIRNLMQRLGKAPATGDTPAEEPPWHLDRRRLTLTSPHGERVELTATEMALMALLARHAGTPLDRADLLAAFGRPPAGPEDRRLDVTLSRLRGKFRSVSMPLKAVRNTGYVFHGAIRVDE